MYLSRQLFFHCHTFWKMNLCRRTSKCWEMYLFLQAVKWKLLQLLILWSIRNMLTFSPLGLCVVKDLLYETTLLILSCRLICLSLLLYWKNKTDILSTDQLSAKIAIHPTVNLSYLTAAGYIMRARHSCSFEGCYWICDYNIIQGDGLKMLLKQEIWPRIRLGRLLYTPNICIFSPQIDFSLYYYNLWLPWL